MEKRKLKFVTYLWKGLKILVFLSFVYTTAVLFRIRSFNTAILILFAVSLFIIFNKIDSMDRKLKTLITITDSLETRMINLEVKNGKEM